MLRLIALIFLLVAPLAVPPPVSRDAATPAPAAAHVCRASGCCETTTRTTCCGVTIVESTCHRSGGVCRCGEIDAPRTPAAPQPAPTTDRAQTSLIFLTATAPRVAVCRFEATIALPVVVIDALVAEHNETCARLGRWRT